MTDESTDESITDESIMDESMAVPTSDDSKLFIPINNASSTI